MTNDEIEYVYKTDSFEEKIKKLMPNMTDKDLASGAEQTAYVCKCPTCPTYQGVGEEKVVFCVLGRTALISKKKGCLCRECPNTKMMSLRWDYYCTQHNAFKLSETEKENNIIIPLLGKYE